jgi:protein-disulfide isomerase
MRTNRFFVALAFVTVTMQGIILYRQYSTQQGTPASQRADPVREAPKDTVLDSIGLPTKGPGNSNIVLVEFSDYECPFCQRHANGAARELDQKYVSTGKIKHVFVNNPLPFHGNAKLLASAAICAGAQDQYWRMHESLFISMPKSKEQILAIVNELEIDSARFEECLRSSSTEATILQDIKTAASFGLSSTPSFALGVSDLNGRVHIKKYIIGAVAFDVFDKVINETLSGNVVNVR